MYNIIYINVQVFWPDSYPLKMLSTLEEYAYHSLRTTAVEVYHGADPARGTVDFSQFLKRISVGSYLKQLSREIKPSNLNTLINHG